jgi:uncharacterized membrane protein YjfL (UPF0719 family)
MAHVGYFTGLILTIGGTIIGPSAGLFVDLINIALYGSLGIILLNISMRLNDLVILSKFKIHDEIIRDQNAGTGAIEGANAIATGLILMGAISGEGGGILTALAFWAIGQVILFITALVYNLITPYDIHHHIEKDNVAVGVGFAGAMIALGNLIRHGLMIDFVNWQTSLLNVGYDVLIGLFFLPIARLIADKLLLPGQKLTDEIVNQEKPNIGAATVEALAYVGGSVLISWSV